ncbi:hypothetical protein [Psychrobacter piscatorii]|uniref:hypothetical protein n=1 Tax=Psychrobacter piscatorii TaxID=554343 RepID=UPI0037355D4A
MTKYYTQEQIDEIGVFMAGKIGETTDELKSFLKQKLAEMEPAEPAPSNPETGGDTPPASGSSGMFLDDGREIKQKLIKGSVQNNELSPSSQTADHGLDISKIIALSATVENMYGEVVIQNTVSQYYPHNTFATSINSQNISFVFTSQDNMDKIDLSKCQVLITYLA